MSDGWFSSSITDFRKLGLDPFESIPHRGLELSFHGEEVVGRNPFLPLDLWVSKGWSLVAWSIETVGI